ncbi:MAG: shikimate dehydrogenase [Lachnospiraceae bacterium]|nr:shikimate dehydrogenase [Lachnospiraceae bacterium]
MSHSITGHTGLLCLLGSPVEHSISPAMHNEACELLDLDYKYLAFNVSEEQMKTAVEGLRTMNCRGWNITMPGKNIMCKLADKLSPASEISGACNTIVNDNGVLTGYTTDGIGFMSAVKDCGEDIIGKKMTLLGAGGAATAILVQAALDGLKEIRVFNVRDGFYERAEAIVSKLNERTSCKVTLHDYSDPEILRASIADSDILVNGTSVGMAPGTDRTIITDTSMFHPNLFVFDVIYNPQETRLLKEAKAAGCRTANGMYMLLYQGAASFELWTGKKMPVDAIKEKFFDKIK